MAKPGWPLAGCLHRDTHSFLPSKPSQQEGGDYCSCFVKVKGMPHSQPAMGRGSSKFWVLNKPKIPGQGSSLGVPPLCKVPACRFGSPGELRLLSELPVPAWPRGSCCRRNNSPFCPQSTRGCVSAACLGRPQALSGCSGTI